MSDHKLRVCLWTPLPPPMGGISGWALNYLEVAERHGLEVRVVNVAPPPGPLAELSTFRFDRLGVVWRSWVSLWRELRHHRPDVCHVTSSLAWATPRDAVAVLMCRLLGVPSVLHIRVSTQLLELRERLSSFWRFLFDRFLGWAGVVLVLSSELEQYLGAALPHLPVRRLGLMVRPHVVPEGGEPALPPRSGRSRVLFVGSISPMKGIIELARAVLALSQCELIVVGGEARAGDEENARLQQDALDRLREQGRLIEMGQLSSEAVARAYEEVDVFVLPSHREGLPNVILEALVAGTPTVATPVGAIPDLLEDDCGVLVPLKDAGALEAALRELIESPERRRELADKGRTRVEERYSIDVVMRGYVEIYRSIVNRTTTPPVRSM